MDNMDMSSMGRKAVSGKVLTMVVTLIIAVVGLVILWVFLSASMPQIAKAVEDLIYGFKKKLCDSMPAVVSNICKGVLGV